NLSEREFRISGNSVRFGLEAVKGVGSSAIEVLLGEREQGVFTSFEDILKRVDNKRVNKKVIESLIKAGAFDSLYNNGSSSYPPDIARAKAMAAFASPMRLSNAGPGLFGDVESPDASVPRWDEKTLLQHEKEALGFYISGHPLCRYRKTLTAMDVRAISAVADMDDREDVFIAGILSDVKIKAREKGVSAVLSLEDETGSSDIMVYPALYRNNAQILKKGNVVIIHGQVFRAEKGARIMAREVRDVTDMEVITKYEVSFKCGSAVSMNEKMRQIREFMDTDANGKGNVSLTFRFYLPGYCVIIASRLQPTGNFVAEAERITGAKVKIL